jgi:hypothetical protein
MTAQFYYPYNHRQHWSPGLERETRERTEEEAHILFRGAITITYSSTTGTCEGCAHHLHERLSKALLRAPSSNKKAAVYRRSRLVQAGDVDWWDEMMNNYDMGGILATGTK